MKSKKNKKILPAEIESEMWYPEHVPVAELSDSDLDNLAKQIATKIKSKRSGKQSSSKP